MQFVGQLAAGGDGRGSAVLTVAAGRRSIAARRFRRSRSRCSPVPDRSVIEFDARPCPLTRPPPAGIPIAAADVDVASAPRDHRPQRAFDRRCRAVRRRCQCRFDRQPFDFAPAAGLHRDRVGVGGTVVFDFERVGEGAAEQDRRTRAGLSIEEVGGGADRRRSVELRLFVEVIGITVVVETVRRVDDGAGGRSAHRTLMSNGSPAPPTGHSTGVAARFGAAGLDARGASG